jgi:CubicO group peptidase (beta-lactamase class C family)
MDAQRSQFDTSGGLERALRLLQGFVDRGETLGVALAIGVDGQLAGEAHVGHARPGVPAGQQTLWPLASISKLYTAAAVMSLVERGEVTLATPICSVLPRFSGGEKERVCLWHLLTHTSGLIYEAPEMAELLERQTALDAIVDEVYERPLLFTPGARHSYSDLGYALAGRVAAAIADMPFPDLVRGRVLEPAGLTQTGMPPRVDDLPRVAHVAGSMAYGTPGAMYNTPYALGLAHPAFGTVASVGDLLRFGLSFANGGPRFLSAATIRAMTTNQLGPWVTTWDAGVVGAPSWGLGFMLRGQFGPAPHAGDLLPAGAFGHGGASGCALYCSPLDGITIAFVSNQHASTDFNGFARRISSVLNVVMASM